jgi:hypothetical protein
MKICRNFLGRIIHSSPTSPAPIILLLFFAFFLNQTIFAGSTSTIANGFPKEMKSSPAVPPEYPQTKSSCEKTPMHCSSLCQTDRLAEVRAAELEKYSRKTRIDADKAAQRAVSVEKQMNKKLQKMSSLKNTSSSGAANPKAKSIWKTVGLIPRLFVSNEANDRAHAEEKEAKKPGTNPLPDNAGQDVSQLLLKSHIAIQAAEEAQKVAADAKSEADQARAYADSVRQSYKSCLSGKESQFNSP